MQASVDTLLRSMPGRGVVLVGLPDDSGSSFLRGAAEAPPRIREALYSSAGNSWTEDGTDLDALPLVDLGDIERDAGPILGRIAAAGHRSIVLGGDHAVTLTVVRAMAAEHGVVDLLQFDAHPDLYDEFEGDRLSHACTFARILEERLVGRLVQIGVRAMNGAQRVQAERFGVEVLEMRRLKVGEPLRFERPLYVSIDLDVLDPSCAPGVSHREPGGMSTRQLLDTLQSIDARLIGADVVELNPRRDPQELTAAVAAKLVQELAALMARE